jgi:crotonobetainyl-CoA:carnitine CoA-transferase CaiB-like acyl-CoA transferase
MWRKFCDAIECPDMFDDPQFADNALRLANRATLDKRICASTARHDRAWWLERFHVFGIPSGAMNDIAEALEHPAIAARGFIKEVQSAVGKVKVFDFPARSSEFEAVNELGPPLLGEHTAAVLAELGISGERLAALQQRGVVECADAPAERNHG